MKKLNILNGVTRSFGKVKMKTMKHSPEILIVAGVIGTVASAVLACKATTKLNDIMDSAKDDIDAIHDAAEHPEELPGDSTYTEEDCKKDLAIVYAQTGVKLVKLYAPAVILGALSITAILTSNNILRKRNVALAAAYAAVDKSFKEYRSRVVDRFGKDLDNELRYNIKAKEIEETVVDEKGKEKVVKKTVNTIDSGNFSGYARVYAEGCTGWTKDPSHNMWVLKSIEDQLNKKLKRKGYLFLNEVYETLGLKKTKEGQVAGWIYDEKNPVGDNRVDFGIFHNLYEGKINFINGDERNIILDFNVDGPILEMM